MIIICEPQFVGFEHVEVNAALIAAMRCAFPQEETLFLAEKQHLDLVNSTLEDRRIKIQFHEIGVPPRARSDLKRLPQELLLCRNVFDIARNNAANKVLFSSMTSPTLISIKVLLRFFNEIDCVAIPHAILGIATARPSLIPTKTPFWLRFWLSFGNMRRLHYLVLSPYIEERLIILLPKVREYVRSVDLPYFFDDEKESKSLDRDPIRFGLLGVASHSKGTDIYFAMAKKILHSHTPSVPQFGLGRRGTDRAASRACRPHPCLAPVPHPLAAGAAPRRSEPLPGTAARAGDRLFGPLAALALAPLLRGIVRLETRPSAGSQPAVDPADQPSLVSRHDPPGAGIYCQHGARALP